MKDVGKVDQQLALLKLTYIWNVSWMKAFMIDTVFYIRAIEIIYESSIAYPFDSQWLLQEPIVCRGLT